MIVETCWNHHFNYIFETFATCFSFGDCPSLGWLDFKLGVNGLACHRGFSPEHFSHSNQKKRIPFWVSNVFWPITKSQQSWLPKSPKQPGDIFCEQNGVRVLVLFFLIFLTLKGGYFVMDQGSWFLKNLGPKGLLSSYFLILSGVSEYYEWRFCHIYPFVGVVFHSFCMTFR